MAKKNKPKTKVERITRVVAWIMLIAIIGSAAISFYMAMSAYFATR